MQIKPSDGATVARLASTRPAPVGQLALEAKAGSVQVSLSETVRILAGALTHELLDLQQLRLGDSLTGEDQLMLARVSALVSSEQLDPNEVVKLALDLSRYRVLLGAPRSQPAVSSSQLLAALHSQPAAPGLQLAAPGLQLAAPGSQPAALRAQPTALLALPTFSPRDETLARTILASVALRTTALERGFVRTLLDPDHTPEHAVDFEFLRRVVVALSAAPGDAALEPTASFERREARATLARALEALALPHADLPSTLEDGVELGAMLVRRRLPALLARSGAFASAALLRTATEHATDAPLRSGSGTHATAALLRNAPEARATATTLPTATGAHVTAALLPTPTEAHATGAPLRMPSDAHATATTLPTGAHATGMPLRTASQALLKREDRALLSVLYAAAHARGQDLTAVDEVAHALVRLRALERADPPAQTQPVAQGEPTIAARDRGAAPGDNVPRDPQAEPRPAAHPALQALDEEVPAALAHNFGSATQRAARASGTYRSLTPPSFAPASLTVRDALAGASEIAGTMQASAPAQPAFLALLTPSRALDLAGALGLSPLLREVRARALRTARARLPARRSDAVRAIEAPGRAAPEADADDPVLDDSPPRKRVRWRLLLSRRRRARSHGDRIS